MVIPNLRVGSHVLLTRAPLSPKRAFDLHVLGLPPAFVLSQDQTLTLNERPIRPHYPAYLNSRNYGSRSKPANRSKPQNVTSMEF